MVLVSVNLFVPARFINDVNEFCKDESIEITSLMCFDQQNYRVRAYGDDVSVKNLELLLNNLTEEYYTYIEGINSL